MRIDRRKLTIALLDADLTQKQFSELTGISRATINGVVNGRSCSNQTGCTIAKALKMEIDDLIEQ